MRHQSLRILGDTFVSLRTRNYRLFFIGQMISNTGNWLTRVALILLVLEITGSGFAVGTVTACEFGPVLVFSAWGGALADRSDKRRLLLLTQALEMVQSVALAAVAFLPNPPVTALYGLALVGGALLAFDNPPRRSFVTEMVPAEDIPNAVVLYSMMVNLSRVFGPALAGLLVTTLGYGMAFALDAASYLAVILCLVIMHPEELFREAGRAPGKTAVREGIAYVMTQRRLMTSFLMLLIIGIFSYNFNVPLPLFVHDTLKASNTVFTVLYSLFSAGSIVGGLIVANRSLVRIEHILIGAVLMGMTLLALAAMPDVPSSAVVVFLSGMATILYMTSTTAIIQVEARRDMHGRVLALQTVCMGGTRVFGGPLLGWVADVAGGRAPFILGGAACLLAAGIGLLAVRAGAADSED